MVTLTLCCLFYGAYRKSGASYTGWWCLALAFWLVGNGSFLLTGWTHVALANPLGNALLVGGAFCVWGGARSLRLLPTQWWHLAIGPTLTALASAIESPTQNAWSGGLAYLVMMATGMALAARELLLLQRDGSKAQRPTMFAASAMVLYFLARGIVYLVDGPEGGVFLTYFSPALTCLLLIWLLIIVSFSMNELSNRQLIRALSERATRDGLTGLLNRHGFLELAERELRSLQGTEAVYTVVLADLDYFKTINDTYGHSAGDKALRAFAHAAVSSVRGTDLVGRYGGEEFILLVAGADRARALEITAKITRRYTAGLLRAGLSPSTASYGIAVDSTAGPGLTALIDAADAALYQAKAAGRDTAVVAGSAA
ncbi:GGDEF domain-containing protein [Paenarthrobacter sp. S56]|uniref:GGDEF domain-containing protein n=1 Tax=Paenarthrobacter sp. S56 TaxID=3138179 RepID=UPI00321B2C7B